MKPDAADQLVHSSGVRCRFPDHFVFGAATAALQIEGALTTDGRGPSMWDAFCREHPERIFEQATPEVACDHYHRWEEDLDLIQTLEHTGYRLSIAWPRIIPDGTGPVNEAGVRFYRNLLLGLRRRGIAPNVTLYHWDLPLPLAQAGGWENPAVIDAFVRYADVCFERFGDCVDRWATLNEPGWSTLNGYVTGLHPPNRQDQKQAIQVATNLVAAHARVMQRYRQRGGRGQVGIALNMCPVYPVADTEADRCAATLADAVLNRWFSDPVLLGRFPDEAWELYEKVGFLPMIADGDRKLLETMGTDFVGVNYYYPHHASADAEQTSFHLNITGNPAEKCLFSVKGLFRFVAKPGALATDWAWEIYPEGLYDVLKRIQAARPELPVDVTENGIGCRETLIDGPVDDRERIEFVAAHLHQIHRALSENCLVRSYYMWSLMDNFSWLNGYKKRYGFLFIDRQNNLQRSIKQSGYWFRDVIRQRGF
jgi:6-phospho-beta-glucosidase